MCYCMIEASSVLPQKSSENYGKCSETIVWPSDKSSESVRKSLGDTQKSRHWYVFIKKKE